MIKTLNRPTLDKVGSLLLFLFTATILYYNILSFSLIENILLTSFTIIAFINILFVLFTPVAKIVNSDILIYSEALPVLLDIRPKAINLSEIKSLIISQKLVFPRVIFKLHGGKMVYHSLPSKRKERVMRFISFIKENTEINIVE
jgi:hypothetical protein